jgi:hypothetical protein
VNTVLVEIIHDWSKHSRKLEIINLESSFDQGISDQSFPYVEVIQILMHYQNAFIKALNAVIFFWFDGKEVFSMYIDWNKFYVFFPVAILLL